MSKREWDEMKTNGFGAFLYRIYLGLTYPVRHPFVTIIVLLAFYRHELTDLWLKYQHKMPEPVQQAALIKKQTAEKIESKLTEMRSSLGQIMQNMPKKNEKAEKNEEVRFVSWNVAKFNKAKYQPKSAVDQPAETTAEPTFAETKQQAQENRVQQIEEFEAAKEEQYKDVFYSGKLSDYYVENNSLNLEYLPEAQHLYGEAAVAGPNSLYIGDKFMFLYGIYTDPDIYDAAEAQDYLEKITEGRKVHCEIVAETYSHTATALCFVQGVFINKALVDRKLARNVALR